MTMIDPGSAKSEKPPASAMACSTLTRPRIGYPPGRATSPVTKSRGAFTSRTITVTFGCCTYGLSPSRISASSCAAVFPSALSSPTIGREMNPSGRTGTVRDRSGSRHTATSRTSSRPILYGSSGGAGTRFVWWAQPTRSITAIHAPPHALFTTIARVSLRFETQMPVAAVSSRCASRPRRQAPVIPRGVLVRGAVAGVGAKFFSPRVGTEVHTGRPPMAPARKPGSALADGHRPLPSRARGKADGTWIEGTWRGGKYVHVQGDRSGGDGVRARGGDDGRARRVVGWIGGGRAAWAWRRGPGGHQLFSGRPRRRDAGGGRAPANA